MPLFQSLATVHKEDISTKLDNVMMPYRSRRTGLDAIHKRNENDVSFSDQRTFQEHADSFGGQKKDIHTAKNTAHFDRNHPSTASNIQIRRTVR